MSEIWTDGGVKTERKSKEHKDRDEMSVRVATCKFKNDMKSEEDERVRRPGKEKDAEGVREKTVNRIFLFKTGCVRNHLPNHRPNCVSFRPLITDIMEN